MDELLSLLEQPEVIGGLIDKYKPAAGSLAKQALDIWAEIVADDRHYNLTAESRWKQYQAYLAAGFDEEQAMELLLNNNAEFVKRVNSFSKAAGSKRS